ncbi:short chain dehydrogenase [Camillea tinctor]|nr:short chain dehydrogenase [Camillea tinctor]
MSFPYKTVLMVGCTAGIGLALAERMIENGVFVIGVGRRKDRLDAFVAKHGPEKAAASQFDITDLDGIKGWAEGIIKSYPTLDCIVLNSGIQRSLNFASPTTIDLALMQHETTTNYTAYVYLMAAFLPHLQSLSPRPASLVAVTSGLALVPLPRCANYCAGKAALHSLLWSARAQLAHDPGSAHIRVVEILPPAVRTELHSLQPDLKEAGHDDFGMPIGEFVDEAWEGLLQGKEEVPVGFVKGRLDAFEGPRREAFKGIVGRTLGSGKVLP